jgi:cysteine desulfuration protein SufE
MYNTKEEIDELVLGLDKAIKMLSWSMKELPSIATVEKEIVEEFALFDSWDDKYEYIIDLGKKLQPLEDRYKLEENKFRGWQSTVWLVADFRDGKIYYKAESDAIIVKGLISMLIRVLSGHSPEEILGTRLDFIQQIGMTTHLAQTRSNGLLSMVKQMKNFALAYKIKNAPITKSWIRKT